MAKKFQLHPPQSLFGTSGARGHPLSRSDPPRPARLGSVPAPMASPYTLVSKLLASCNYHSLMGKTKAREINVAIQRFLLCPEGLHVFWSVLRPFF